MPADVDISSLREVAEAAALAARRVTLAYFRSDRLNLTSKGADEFDPVTQADREAEEAIRAVLADRRPDDAILGEEFGQSPGKTGLTWIIDPIDGTRGFISGTPTWGTLISVGRGDGPIIGLIDQPYTGEMFVGGPGFAEMMRAGTVTKLGVRPKSALAEATILTTFPEIGGPNERAAFHQLASKTRLTRYGMDCYGYALLAAGQVDLVVEAGLQAYDINAPIAVVQAAGGIVTDWQGAPAHHGGRVIAAASAKLHAAALEILSRAAPD